MKAVLILVTALLRFVNQAQTGRRDSISRMKRLIPTRRLSMPIGRAFERRRSVARLMTAFKSPTKDFNLAGATLEARMRRLMPRGPRLIP
jgi:hypothetical protein